MQNSILTGRQSPPTITPTNNTSVSIEEITSPEVVTPGGTAAITVNGPEGIKVWLQNYMLEQMRCPSAERDIIGVSLAKCALYQPIQTFQNKLSEWIGQKFKIKTSKNSNRNKTQGTNLESGVTNVGSQEPNNKQYGQTFTGRGRRAENFKKAQDLYGSNRALIADILAGKSLDGEERMPDIKSVEQFHAKIL